MQTLARLKTRRRAAGLRALSQPPKKRGALWDRARVEAAAAARRRHEQTLASARWATSWMMPWERAQMDVPTRPLKLWERVYWRLFVVLGGVGFAYETWVLGNRRILLPKTDAGLADVGVACVEDSGLYHGNHAFRSHRFLTDDELKTMAGK